MSLTFLPGQTNISGQTFLQESDLQQRAITTLVAVFCKFILSFEIQQLNSANFQKNQHENS